MADIVPPPGARGGQVLLKDMALQNPEDVDIRGGRIVRLREFAIPKGSIDNFTAAAAVVGALTVTGAGGSVAFNNLGQLSVNGGAYENILTGSTGGDVVGPASAVDNNVAVFDGTTGTLIKDGGGAPALLTGATFTGDIGFAAGARNFLVADDAASTLLVGIDNGAKAKFYAKNYIGSRGYFEITATNDSGWASTLQGTPAGDLVWNHNSFGACTIWHSGNDGAASGLDADTVDGSHASAFALLTGATFTGNIAFSLGARTILVATDATSTLSVGASTGANAKFYARNYTGSRGYFEVTAANDSGWASTLDGRPNGDLFWNHNSFGACTIWHSGNDGSGSGLDADTVDGSHASAFAAASHSHAASDITSGTLDNARVNWAAPSAIGTTTRADGYFKSVMIGDTGNYSAGSIYSDSNWGMLFRARVSGALADFMWANSAGTLEQLRIPSVGGIGIPDGQTIPTTVTGIAFIYVDTADGDLKVKFGDGTVKLIVAD